MQGTPMVKEAKDFNQILNDLAMAVVIEVSLTKSNIFFFNTNIAIPPKFSAFKEKIYLSNIWEYLQQTNLCTR